MTMPTTGAVNHVALTVTNMARSRDFYQDLLGFEFIMEYGPKYLLSNGELILGLNPAPDPEQAIPNDRFTESRVGLDHISFNVESLEAMESARQWLDDNDVPRGEIRDLGDLGIYVMAFRDPDNIQLEITAPKA